MSLERKYIDCFDFDRRQKLQRCLDNLNKVDLYPPDPMHDARHQAQVERVGIWLAEEVNLGWEQKDYLRRAIPFHDSGYAFVQMGILNPEGHAIGSGLIALHKTGDVQLARGIVQHSYDVLPRGVTPWVLFLREADRSDRWGWQGVISVAYYLGFRHELISGPVVYQTGFNGNVEAVDLIRDKRRPDTVNYKCRPTCCVSRDLAEEVIWTWTDYEETAANFVRKEVFPYLHGKGLITKAFKELENIQEWIEGVESDDSDWDDPKWDVDSVINEGSYAFFSAKRFNTEQAISELMSYKNLHENDKRDLESWVNLKARTASGNGNPPFKPFPFYMKYIVYTNASRSRKRRFDKEVQRFHKNNPLIGTEIHFSDIDPYINP